MRVGKQMQFFGARVNLAKALLYAINGGRDEITGEQVAPADRAGRPATSSTTTRCCAAFDRDDWTGWPRPTSTRSTSSTTCTTSTPTSASRWRCTTTPCTRFLACGIAGLSVAADSLSAIKYATVTAGPRRHRPGRRLRGRRRLPDLRQQRRPGRRHRRRAGRDVHGEGPPAARPTATPMHTQSVLTITSNVVYGKHTGNTPDGRRAGEPFAPGANPMNGRDRHGMVAAALSVAKLPYDQAPGRHLADHHRHPGRPGPHPRRAGRPTWSACSTATSTPAAST